MQHQSQKPSESWVWEAQHHVLPFCYFYWQRFCTTVLNSTFNQKLKPDLRNVTQIGKSSIPKLESVPLQQALIAHRHATPSSPYSAGLDSNQEFRGLFTFFFLIILFIPYISHICCMHQILVIRCCFMFITEDTVPNKTQLFRSLPK